MQAYQEVARAVIASAVKDLVKGKLRAEEAYQFLCGVGDNNRTVLKFWCIVAGYSPDQVMSMIQGRSAWAWKVWWRAHGADRLKEIQTQLEKMRPRFILLDESGTHGDGGGA
jgi:hypothetical protein